jgi:hypothetical protein
VTEPLLNAPAPQIGMEPQTVQAALRAFDPGLGSFLAASAAEGFWATLAGQSGAQNRVREAEQFAAEAELATLPEDEWRAGEFFRPDVTYRRGMTRATARVLAEVYDENQARRAILSAGNTGWGRTALGFAAGVVGSIPTVENFIPFAGPALNAARAGRFGASVARVGAVVDNARVGGIGARVAAGAGMGAVDATLGTLVAMPFVAASRDSFGDDVTWADMVQDLALGAVAGTVLGGGFGAVFGRQARAPAEVMPPPVQQQDAALRALVASADQLATRDEINAALLPPDVRAELAALRQQNQQLRASMTPEADGSLAGSVAARPIQMTGAAAPGAGGRATTPGGLEIAYQWEVVEAADLVASNRLDFTVNPDFPAELQPRDRTGEERQSQVRNIAARLRPEEVEASPLTTTGAPIISPDRVVESGNGRTLAIQLAYAEALPTAQTYRAALVRAGFADAADMQAPILVRRRTTDLDADQRRRFVEESNADVVDALTPGEQARVDARRLDAAVLAQLRSPDIMAAANADFVRAVVAAMPGRDQRALSTGGTLTADGVQRIRRALAARAYDDPALVARLAESADDAAAPLARALMDAAPALAQLRSRMEAGQVRPELDALPALTRAVRRVQDALDNNKPLRPLLDQPDILDTPNPVEQAWLHLLLRQPISQKIGGVGRDTLVQRMDAYVRAATDAPSEPDMFGTPPPGIGDTMAVAFREAGLDLPPELRGLVADPFTPPREPARQPELTEEPPPPAPPAAPAASPPPPAVQRTGAVIMSDIMPSALTTRLQPGIDAVAARLFPDSTITIGPLLQPRRGATAQLRVDSSDAKAATIRVTTNRSDAAVFHSVFHELGHLWYFQNFKKAAPELQDEIIAQHRAEMMAVKGRDGMNTITPRPAAMRAVESALRDSDAELAARRAAVADDPAKWSYGDRHYAEQFDEWFAERFARWLTTNEAPASVLERFFQDAINILRQVYATALRLTGFKVEPGAIERLLSDRWNAATPLDTADLPDDPAPPSQPGAQRDPAVQAAAAQGLNAEAGAELAEAQRLVDAGNLPPELAEAMREADAMAAKVTNAQAAWGEAAACAIRG